MKNYIDYIHKYGHLSFSKKGFNEIDNLVFSVIAYLNLSDTCAVKNGHTLEEIAREYLQKNRYRDIRKLGLGASDAYKLLIECLDAPRFSKVTLSNYVYVTDHETQFGAMTFHLTPKLDCIAFEGTDQTLGGWKEDAYLACFYPVTSHVLGANYLRKHIKYAGPNVILCGHSKGGNTALVSAMSIRGLKQNKIRAIYSNDGPGLRLKQFESKAYQTVLPKYHHIVSNRSIVGMLLRKKKSEVVKTSAIGFLAHMPSTWLIIDDKLRKSKLEPKSQAIYDSLISWLDNHNDEQRLKMVNGIFDWLNSNGLKETTDFANPKNFIKLVGTRKDLDKETIDLAIDLAKYAFGNIKKA